MSSHPLDFIVRIADDEEAGGASENLIEETDLGSHASDTVEPPSCERATVIGVPFAQPPVVPESEEVSDAETAPVAAALGSNS